MSKSTRQQSLRILKLFWRFAWAYPAYVLGILFCVPITILIFRFLPPLIISDMLQKMSQGNFVQQNLGQSFGPELIAYALLVFVGGVVLWRFNVYLIWQLEMRVLQDIHQTIFNHLVSQSANFHANRFGGSLVSQTNKFAGAYIRLADTVYFQLMALVMSFVFTIVLLWGKAPLVVVLLIGFSILFMAMSILITGPVRRLNTKEAKAATKQTGALADVVTNIMALKSFAATKSEQARYLRANKATRAATKELMWASLKREAIFAGSTTSLGIAALVIATIAVVYFNADIAVVFLVVTYTGIITQNLWEFSQQTLRNVNRALGDATDMAEILSIEPEVVDPSKPEKARINRGAIQFKSVLFSHKDSSDEPLFENFNVSIKPGEKIGLVGHSGSGKTTLTKVLLRFADIQAGEILIDSQNIARIRQDDLRQYISYVPQEPLLFHRSLYENIAYGRPEASQQEVMAIARMSNAHEFIERLPDGYETLVGERGVKLSGGQRQRVAIARAMIKNAPILVLDEATSALDSESEVLIQDALWRLMEGRTAIVIAHRLSTIQKMDRIIVMDNGKIVEQGTHKELTLKDGVYSSLWTHQSGGFLED